MEVVMLFEDISEKIIYSFFQVHKELKGGLLEKPYKHALFIELKKII